MNDHERLVKTFVAERNAALLTLDEQVLRAHFLKWHIPTPTDPLIFWAGVHKSRTAVPSLPMQARLVSKMWLMARGFQSNDDGELATGFGSAA